MAQAPPLSVWVGHSLRLRSGQALSDAVGVGADVGVGVDVQCDVSVAVAVLPTVTCLEFMTWI